MLNWVTFRDEIISVVDKPCDGNCWFKGDGAKLLISNISNIGWISIMNETKTNNFELVIETDHAVLLDYDMRDNKLYWTNPLRDQILSFDFNDTKNIMVIAENIDSIGIAVDWIHKHLYWTDQDLRQIAVSTLDGQMRRTLITKDVGKPRAIVVEPNSGYIYWTDWGKNPRIEKCGLDGTMREIIVQNDMEWPNGITVDFDEERLYWVEARLDYIASVDYDGGNRRTVYQSSSNFHPLGITMFGDTIYWTDWITDSVNKMNKYGSSEPVAVFSNLREPMGVQIIHESRQPLSKNKCGTDNGGCSDFCLPSPITNNGRQYSCVCRDNFTLSYDEMSCVAPEAIETSRKPSTTARRTPTVTIAESKRTGSFEKEVLLKLKTVKENQKESLILLRELINEQDGGKVLDKTITNKTDLLTANNQDRN
ncbi:hypothetical protein SNE40_019421 [Patella caerulea]|uniref:Uncharacterized protein n=1 Tax=Patella caerulea TaxID=87958 RepID=A0AAN8J9E9_PATCE